MKFECVVQHPDGSSEPESPPTAADMPSAQRIITDLFRAKGYREDGPWVTDQVHQGYTVEAHRVFQPK